jgi:hypothetical protein
LKRSPLLGGTKVPVDRTLTTTNCKIFLAEMAVTAAVPQSRPVVPLNT